VTTEFACNNKVQTSTKVSLFKDNSGREPRMGFELRKNGKFEKVEEFVKKIKDIHEEAVYHK